MLETIQRQLRALGELGLQLHSNIVVHHLQLKPALIMR